MVLLPLTNNTFFSFTRNNHILSRIKVHTAGRVGPKETDLQCLICPICNMLLDLYDLSNLLIVRFIQFVTHCLMSRLKLIDLLFVTHYMVCLFALFVTYM